MVTPSFSRRRFLKEFGGVSIAAGSSIPLTLSAGVEAKGGRRRLRAAMGNGGLQNTWGALGKDTADLWGELLNVEVVWFDGESNPEKQRSELDRIASQDWDFVAVQAIQNDSLAPPVRRLKARNIPVISMDTELVSQEKMRETGVWMQIEPDQRRLGEMATEYLAGRIRGQGRVIHIGGSSGHSGARGRRDGFESVVANYPEIEVVGGEVRWCDWEMEEARSTFEALLNQTQEPIAGAFFHSDDMALASVDAIDGTRHKGMVVTSIDGTPEGLKAVREGALAATAVNPSALIHRIALTIGQFIVRNGESVNELPLRIVTPGPLVSREAHNIEAQLYLAHRSHCLV